MKNIQEKIEFSFEPDEIRKVELYSKPSLFITKIMILALLSSYLLFYFRVDLPTFLIMIIILYGLLATIFFPIIFIVTYVDHKMSYLTYLKKKEKYRKRMEKEFDNFETVFYIYKKLNGTRHLFTDEDFYKFYNNYNEIDFDKINEEESKELAKIHKKYSDIKQKKIAELIG